MSYVRGQKEQELFERMRGFVTVGGYLNAALLLDRAIKATGSSDPDGLYSFIQAFAQNNGYDNPFQDSNQLLQLAQVAPEGLDWEAALELEEKAYRETILPEVLFNKFSDRITEETSSILIAEAEKFVPHLKETVDSHRNVSFTLTSQNHLYADIFERLFEGYDNVEVLCTTIYEPETLNKRYDLIFSLPMFGGRVLSDSEVFMCRDFECIALENLSYYLSGAGELVIILPAKVTFAAGRIPSLRRFIQENYSIRELAALPQGIFDGVGIKTYFMNIENTRPSDNDITVRIYTAGKRKSRLEPVTELIVEEDTFIMPDELSQLGDWNIEKIFALQDEEWLKYQNSGVMKDQLRNVAGVFRGKTITKKDPVGTVGVINISSIGEFETDYDKADYITEEERKLSNYVLQEGDVLIPARGTAIRTSVFKTQSYPFIANSNVIVIRPDTKRLDPTYLKIFLDSPLGNKLISGAQQGMNVMNISYKDLMNLEIPVPSLEEQQRIAKEYTEEYERYKQTIAQAEARWTEVRSKLQEF